MYIKYNLLFLLFFSCVNQHKKNSLIVYPEYCGGCVSKNFTLLNNSELKNDFYIYFDTTDMFILNTAKENNLMYNHIDNNEIPIIYGDYANIVIKTIKGKTIELKTNETLKKGKHY